MNTKQTKLSIIIVTYNNQKEINTCLSSLKHSLDNYGKKSEVIVIDNASKDATIKTIDTSLTSKVIINRNNTGFAKAVNQGIRFATGDFILLLNPDTELRRDSIKTLMRCSNNQDADILEGKSIDSNDKEHGSYVRKPTLLTMIFEYTNLRKIVPGDIIHNKHYYKDLDSSTFCEVDAVSGAYMLLRKNIFEKVGFFDERFFMYLEDVDFCVRAKKYGYKVGYCPSSIIEHIGGASSKNRDKIRHKSWYQSRRYYANKHFSLVENILIQPMFYIDTIISEIWKTIKQ